MNRFSTITLLLCTATFHSSVGAEIYKWVDDKGRVHYSSKPPASAKATSGNAKRLNLQKPRLRNGLRTTRNAPSKPIRSAGSEISRALEKNPAKAVELIHSSKSPIKINDLAYATQHNHNKALEAMLEKVPASSSAPEYLKMVESQSLLDMAAERGNSKAIHILMTKDPTRFGTLELSLTALIKAIQANKAETVNQLISFGVDVNANDSLALKKAAESGNIEIATILIRNYANVNPQATKRLARLGRVRDVNLSPLALAVKNNHFGMIKLLIENGADINTRNTSYGTALDIAKKQKNETVIRYLTLRGAKPSKDTLRAQNNFY